MVTKERGTSVQSQTLHTSNILNDLRAIVKGYRIDDSNTDFATNNALDY